MPGTTVTARSISPNVWPASFSTNASMIGVSTVSGGVIASNITVI